MHDYCYSNGRRNTENAHVSPFRRSAMRTYRGNGIPKYIGKIVEPAVIYSENEVADNYIFHIFAAGSPTAVFRNHQ